MRSNTVDHIPRSTDRSGALVIKVPTQYQLNAVKERLLELGINCLSHVEVVDLITARSAFSDAERDRWVASQRGRNQVCKYCLEHNVDVVVTTHRLNGYIPINFGREGSVLDGYVNGVLSDMRLVNCRLHLGSFTVGSNIIANVPS